MQTTSQTTLACWKTYWNCIAFELGTLCGFVFFVLCRFGLFYFSPLMRQLQNNIWGTISRIGSWGTNTKIAFELGLFFNLLLYFYFNFYIFFHLFIYLFIYFLVFIFNPLCLANDFSAYGWIVHCLSLFISLKFFLFLCFVFFSTCLFVFPFSFNFLPFHLLSHLHSKYH
jgi:hypothetical protein